MHIERIITISQRQRSHVVVVVFSFLSKEKEQELEQLTKELRQVNLQQFIQQTGTKVTVLPAQPAGENNGMWTHTHAHTCTQRHMHTNAHAPRECLI